MTTRHRLPHSMTCRRDVLTSQASLLTAQSNAGPTNQPDKPPSEGVPLAWRSHHATGLNYTHTGRVLPLPLKRVSQRRNTNELRHTAILAEMPHNQNRIHDGQDWSYLGHSLPTSQSGQE
jgi:hypothetical protein